MEPEIPLVHSLFLGSKIFFENRISVSEFLTTTVRPVSQMTKRDAGVFGWMLECAQTGVFKGAEAIFAKANQIYRRVTFEAAPEGIDL